MSKKTRPTPSPSSPLAGWQSRAIHTVTCPSGQRLKIRIPGLATILEHGDLPEDLVDIALLEVASPEGAAGVIARRVEADDQSDEDRAFTLRRIREYAVLQQHLVCEAILEVEVDGQWQPVSLSMEDVRSLPEDDLAMVAEIVQRLRHMDARGVRIGVEPLDRWATFCEEHQCDPDCPSCAAVVRRLSSADVGQV